MLASPSIWTPPKKKVSILPWADASNNSLEPSVKLLNFWECKIVTFNFETIQGKIYIAGISSRPDLLEEMVLALKNIKGVNEIVNYVIIREKL